MPHIHDKIDFTVAIFVVQQAQVLLVHHRALDKWLPHIGMIYFARPRDASAALQLAPTEHHAIRWCRREELQALSPLLSGAVRWYCEQALREIA